MPTLGSNMGFNRFEAIGREAWGAMRAGGMRGALGVGGGFFSQGMGTLRSLRGAGGIRSFGRTAATGLGQLASGAGRWAVAADWAGNIGRTGIAAGRMGGAIAGVGLGIWGLKKIGGLFGGGSRR